MTALVRDGLTRAETRIRARWLFGADGARSRVVDALGLPLLRGPGGGPAWNVLVGADLAHLMGPRPGNLHWVLRPWDRWLFILFPAPGAPADACPPRDAIERAVRDMIGDDTSAHVVDVSRWHVNDVVAARYSDGNV